MSVLSTRSLMRVLAPVLLALPIATIARAQTYTFASASPFTATQTLTPGQWSIGVSGGSWNETSGYSTGCDSSGGACYYGWFTGFHYRLNGGAWIFEGYNQSWLTPELAIANEPPPATLTIAADTRLDITLLDSYYGDNYGSQSVTVSAVSVAPEPSSIVLMASGLFGVAGLVRRRQRIARK